MKVTPTLLSIKSFVVRVLACLLITALLAPLTIPLAAKESRGIAVSPAAITGNLSAAEPMSFSGVSDNAGGGASAFLEKQFSRARSILPTPSLAFFGSTDAGASDNNSNPTNDNRSNDNPSDEKLSRATDKKTSSTNEDSNSATTDADLSEEVEAGDDDADSSQAESVVPTAPAKNSVLASNTKSAAALSAPLLPTKTAFDFDGDLKADAAVWRPSDGTWWVLKSTTQDVALQQWGASGDRIVPADYDNDNKTDYAVFTPASGIWSILQSSNGQSMVKQWGAPTDIPVPGDFDADGKADIAVWRPSTGVWYINKSSDGSWYSVGFGSGSLGDIPVVGDYDADGKSDIAVWRASNGIWYAQRSSDGVITGPQWGGTNDVPVPADYDGDGKTDFAVWRPSAGGGAGEWFVLNSSNGGMSYAQLGASTPPDVVAPADYDGDGKAEMAVWRPSTGTWYIWKIATSTLWQTALGVAGDIPVPSAAVKQTGANPAPTPIPQPTSSRAAIGRARLSPKNATAGTDLYSRNFSWGTGLVNLPGRAGMDAGLSLSYNSLVWTKVGNEIIFDADKGNVAPGFRFGFPVIEPVYTDEQTGKSTFLMVSPSGGRTELRQVGSSNFYEAVDSSYLQLERTVGGTQEQQQFVLRSTDGTQLKYVWKAGAYRCAEIKDSNGNRITVNHDGAGLLRTIKDTLDRVISISYDNALNPTSITQDWGGVTHTWAWFSYATIQINHNFSGITVTGPANNSSIKVLERVTFADQSSVRFDYNSYGQVSQVNNHAADTHKLNHVAADYAVSVADCPRLSQTRSYIENFNGNQETVVTNSTTENQPVPGTSSTGTLIQVSMNGHPNNAVSKTYVGASGWLEGLPIVTEDWADGAKKRWTWNSYTQDDPNLSYILNPRVIEIKVGDESNTKRTTISYNPQFGLVSEVKQYQADQTTVIKRSTTIYNLDAIYTARRIIGLPQESNLFDGANNLLSKVTYAYDGHAFSGTEENIAPVQHDSNYGAGFIIGRGNLTSTTRYDVTSTTTAVTSSVRYNTAGAVVSQTNPMNRSVSISYADAFSDGQSRNTFAYPTKITELANPDVNNNSSYIKYRYDIGANVWAKSPAPIGNSTGKVTTREFDAYGRLERQTLVNNGAYTRYVHDPNKTLVTTYSTVTEGQGETKAETYTDGAGRMLRARSAFSWSGANVSTWSGQITEYDINGRVKKQSPPTEIDSNWQPVNEDYRGTNIYLWTSQVYDWKGRVVQTTNTDGTTQVANYEGCGCAGGEIVTIKGEEIFERDWQGNVTNPLGRRTQKIYSDILGRAYKTETYNWNGTGLPYTTTVNTFNGRDQITLSRQYEGAEGSTVFQDTIMSYDGHGRLKTQHLPEQDAGKSTVFDYNPDGTLQRKTDARGASENYTYNERGLLNQVSYGVPSGQAIYPYINSVWNNRNTITNGLSVYGGNFDSNVEIIASKQVTNNGITTSQELARYTGGQITRTPDGNPGEESLRFQMIETEVLNAYNSAELHLQVLNPSSDKMSLKIKLGDFQNGQAPSVWHGSGNFHVVPQTPTVTYQYDALGNRISMIDGAGRVDYAYNELSQIKSENRQLNNITNHSSADGKFKLSYEYTLSGSLKNITDPFGAKINYNFDKIGQITGVTGDITYAGITTYASEMNYRAWGSGKHVKYGNNNTLDVDYNSRLDPKKYDLLNSSGTRLMGADYKYFGDGALQFVDDFSEERLDRKYNLDSIGRVSQAVSGSEANGTPNNNNSATGPYSISYGYDAFDNLTSKSNGYWYAGSSSASISQTYRNNRVQGLQWMYDEDGRPIKGEIKAATYNRPAEISTYRYDAAGRILASYDSVLDGDGYEIKASNGFKYYIRSSVLGGGVVSEVAGGGLPENNGIKLSTFVFLEGVVIAEQTDTIPGASAGAESINWIQKDPAETSSYAGGKQWALDPQGIATEAPNYAALSQYPDYYSQRYNSYNYGRSYDPWQGTGVNSPNSSGAGGGVPGSPMTCIFMGANIPCGTVPGGAIQCPNNDCGPRNVNGSLTPIVYGVGVGWGATQTRRQEQKKKPTLKVVPKGTPRPVVNPNDFEKPIVPNDELMGPIELTRLILMVVTKVKIVGFDDEQHKAILNNVFWMVFNKSCGDAFKTAGIPTPAEQLKNYDLTVVAGNLLSSPTDDNKWQGDDYLRKLGSPLTDSFGVGGFAHIGPYKNRTFLFINKDVAFKDESIFSETFPHEMAHVSGAPRIDSYWFFGLIKYGHDLTHMGDKYKRIVNDCRVPKK